MFVDWVLASFVVPSSLLPYVLLRSLGLLPVSGAMWRLRPPSVKLGESLPPALESVILRCLAKHASDRYCDAGALAAALDEIAAMLPWPPDRVATDRSRMPSSHDC